MRVGIHGIGLYLPPQVRDNDWWPEAIVDVWRRIPPPVFPSSGLSDGARRCIAGMTAQAADPFQGYVRRHVMPEEMALVDMEEQAARRAVEMASIDPAKIDLLITNRTVPDVLLGNPACELHARLGLPRRCLSTHLDVATHSFMMQVALAEAAIAAGRATYALLVQACAPSRLIDPADRISCNFGDAATAVVLGPVAPERGILSAVTFTDGRYPRTLIASVPGKRWYDDGVARLHIGDPRQLGAVFLQTADVCRESVEAALAAAGRPAADVGFLAIHQGTPWLRSVVQEETGLVGARSVETYQETGYTFASTIPTALVRGYDTGAISAGDLAVLVGGGPGQTYGAIVLVWGT